MLVDMFHTFTLPLLVRRKTKCLNTCRLEIPDVTIGGNLRHPSTENIWKLPSKKKLLISISFENQNAEFEPGY